MCESRRSYPITAKWNNSRTMLLTTGTVSVSFPSRVMSSVYAPNRETVAALRRQRKQMDNIRQPIRQFIIAINKLEKTYEARSSKFGSQSSEFWLMYTLDDGQPHPQKQICLTEDGKAHAKQLLSLFYQAENRAMEETLKLYSTEFVDAIIYYNKCLSAEFNRELGI